MEHFSYPFTWKITTTKTVTKKKKKRRRINLLQERPLLVQTLHPINGITVDSVCYFLVFYLLISVYKKVFKFWIWNEVANMQNSNSNFNLTKISWTAMCRFYLESKGSSRQTLNMMSWHVWNVFCKELHALRGLSEYLQYNIKTIHHCWVSKLGPDSVRMVNTFKKTYKQTNKKNLLTWLDIHHLNVCQWLFPQHDINDVRNDFYSWPFLWRPYCSFDAV